MDVLALDAKTSTLIHIEVLADAIAWPKLQGRIGAKFNVEREIYRSIFDFDYAQLQRVAIIFSVQKPGVPVDVSTDIKLIFGQQLMFEIIKRAEELLSKGLYFPEQHPRLRAIEYGIEYGRKMQRD